ncbi:PH domain-containing protein [Thermobispora bispora]|uniref:PH domain-containing protein n=1 Tax=Thermobispora bispora TaxID=2006 RepID=UPI001F11D101|nr:PH domain-containing protein [Thermobispora bispora]
METPVLRAPAHRVSRTAIWYWFTKALLGWLIAAGFQAFWVVVRDHHEPLRIAALTATVVLAVPHIAVMPWWRYRVHRWEATPLAVYTRSGWLTQEWRIAPISRIQTVDSVQGPLERLFRLATVTVTTASAAGPVRVSGLGAETARRLVAELTANVQSTTGDAT